jgi:hypothetical protein
LSVYNISVTLQVWRFVGDPAQPDEFLNQLVLEPEDSVQKLEGIDSCIDIMSIEIGEFADADEPTEAFATELENRLTKTAHWLEKQPIGLFQSLREKGFFTNLLFTGWIDSDQLDLNLPPSLLLACGNIGLNISIITND